MSRIDDYRQVAPQGAVDMILKLADRVRGRVMALWIMAFGGMVPLGTLAAGPVATHTSITLVMLVGAGVAALLAWYCDLTAVGVPV